MSFKNITDDDIDYVEDNIKQKGHEILKNMAKKNIAIQDDILVSTFGETFAAKPAQFTFLRGERQLIKSLVEHVQKEVDKGGVNRGVLRFREPPKQPKIQTNTEKCGINGTEPMYETKSHYFLKKLLSAADRNSTRKKGGYRYDDDIKFFASLLRMLTGPLAYEILQKNLECCLPSLPSTNRYIRSSNHRIIEGILRRDELKIYLEERNLPLIVSLSEDATKITGRVQYDAFTDQLVGFVLPISKQNGMPIPFSFPAQNAKQILRHFSNPNKVSPYVNAIMAQPIAPNVPAICILIFGSDCTYTSEDVSKRWLYITSELAKSNIKVLTISSDSDSKYNGAMCRLSQLGIDSPGFPKWFSCGNEFGPFYMQDLIHIATKMRNFLLRKFWRKTSLPFGKYFVKMEHLFVLLDEFTKDHHELTASILTPTDRQNFKSVQRMCDLKVINLLRAHVKDSEATTIFLQILRDIIISHTDKDLTPLQRIRKMWYSLFLIRIWRKFIVTNQNYSLKENFLTSNCYSCIELNAHNLVWIILHLKSMDKPELFQPYLFSSQPCENLFRLLRSFTTTYSTVANCSSKEAISRISKIHFQNEIMYTTSPQFMYPRLKKTSSEENKPKCSLPSRDEIITEIEFCLKAAVATAKKVGLIEPNEQANQMFECKINLRSFPKKRTVHCVRNKNLSKILQFKDLRNIQLKDFSGKVKVFDGSTSYTEIVFPNDKRVVVKKTSLCWLLSPDYKKLSSDRLQRVRSTSAANGRQTKKQTNVSHFTKPIYSKRICKSRAKQRLRLKKKLR